VGATMGRPSDRDVESLYCSFCRKSQDSVSKLISTPGDDPRAYICNECIAVCASILEDDRGSPEASGVNVELAGEPHPLLSHPLASPFLTAVEHWVRKESLGADAAEELAEMRGVAIRMMRVPDA
jgi:hypothetical protein